MSEPKEIRGVESTKGSIKGSKPIKPPAARPTTVKREPPPTNPQKK
jgi:hypothetical protein